MRPLTVTKTARVNGLAFSPDGSRLAVASARANVRVWGLASGNPIFNLKGSKDSQFAGFAGDDGLVVSSWGTAAVFWDLRAKTSRPLGPAPGYCWDTAVSPDGTRLARAEGRVVCRDVADGRTVWEADWQNVSGVSTRVRFAAGGDRVFVVGQRVAVRDAATGAEVGGFDLTFPRYAHLSTADVSPDGRWLATRGYGGLRVWDAADGRVVFEEPSISYGYALAFTPDGSRLAAGPYGGTRGVDFWDVGTWRREPSLDLGIGTVLSLAFSADGHLGAAGGFEGGVAVWDVD